jgi:hypothetical protein
MPGWVSPPVPTGSSTAIIDPWSDGTRDHALSFLFEHDLQANASRLSREKPVSAFPDRAPGLCAAYVKRTRPDSVRRRRAAVVEPVTLRLRDFNDRLIADGRSSRGAVAPESKPISCRRRYAAGARSPGNDGGRTLEAQKGAYCRARPASVRCEKSNGTPITLEPGGRLGRGPSCPARNPVSDPGCRIWADRFQPELPGSCGLVLPPLRKPPPLARGCASCAGRTAPGSPPPIPSRAGTVWRSGMPVRGARRSGSAPDRR